jgi:hypothetical protein
MVSAVMTSPFSTLCHAVDKFEQRSKKVRHSPRIVLDTGNRDRTVVTDVTIDAYPGIAWRRPVQRFLESLDWRRRFQHINKTYTLLIPGSTKIIERLDSYGVHRLFFLVFMMSNTCKNAFSQKTASSQPCLLPANSDDLEMAEI